MGVLKVLFTIQGISLYVLLGENLESAQNKMIGQASSRTLLKFGELKEEFLQKSSFNNKLEFIKTLTKINSGLSSLESSLRINKICDQNLTCLSQLQSKVDTLWTLTKYKNTTLIKALWENPEYIVILLIGTIVTLMSGLTI